VPVKRPRRLIEPTVHQTLIITAPQLPTPNSHPVVQQLPAPRCLDALNRRETRRWRSHSEGVTRIAPRSQRAFRGNEGKF
jgi:hypothetical protein